MALTVQRRMVPPAGIDIVEVTLKETYEVEGIGQDTVELRGELEAHRTAPLFAHGSNRRDWDNATVVAQFVNLSLAGESQLFGPVRVSLNRAVPSFGAVTAGKCVAAMAIRVSMPKHGLVMESSEPVQLQSQVETIPPIGDERTESVGAVDLVDAQTKRVRGRVTKVLVAWRELLDQKLL